MLNADLFKALEAYVADLEAVRWRRKFGQLAKSLTHNVSDHDQGFAILRVMSWTDAMSSQAVELSMVLSKSLASPVR